MTYVSRQRLALARSLSRPVWRLINGYMSGAPDGMSMHTDDQAAILYRYSRKSEIPYGHVQGDIQIYASQMTIFSAHMDALILRSSGAGLCAGIHLLSNQDTQFSIKAHCVCIQFWVGCTHARY